MICLRYRLWDLMSLLIDVGADLNQIDRVFCFDIFDLRIYRACSTLQLVY